MGSTTAEAAREIGEVVFARRGHLGLITLNRPKALNALTHGMALAIEATLARWGGDDSVAVVVVMGEGDRAFCAGGDIRALYDAGCPGGPRGAANFRFYEDEYRLNAAIRAFPKPYVAIMDGIVMGGGVGVSIHGSLRIATERTVFAMPETGIGLFPDVGATYVLPRLAGGTGLWLGLTGARLKGHDAVRAGLCDLMLPSHRIAWLIDWLAEGRWDHPPEGRMLSLNTPDDGVQAHLARPGLPEQAVIDRCFAARSIGGIFDRLEGAGTDWAEAQAAAIRAKSPTCTAIAFRQLRLGAMLCFDACMALEYRLARFCMTHPDFYEGVRAAIIDKDGAPIWSPASLDAVDHGALDDAFDLEAALPG
ncbi:MAG: enoyl-CoA hydratase/isomerase family protein [Pseudomonadota bacterium]